MRLLRLAIPCALVLLIGSDIHAQARTFAGRMREGDLPSKNQHVIGTLANGDYILEGSCDKNCSELTFWLSADGR